ncbi:hypothetical protein [Rhizobium rhizogenes]|uniref:hypothetical protein n=1 Tax=Rhizobium rhizogenes TaxID=359 RepID=UPI001571DED6|nr:hypothetical protein [Rhizobium rhizogenes]NTF72767.1 hypothetical protein [Rhizobium rhizogenes]
MRSEEIEPKKTYIGGRNDERRTIVGWGASEAYVVWGRTSERLPLGGFVNTKCTSRASFAKWAKAETE